MSFLTGLIENTPIWVWPLFAFLLMMGLISTRQRKTPLAILLGLPFLVILPLRTIIDMPSQIPAWGGFVLGYILGALMGAYLQKGWIIQKHRFWVELKGEWMTLITLMVIFWANFAFGFINATAPELLNSDFATGLFAFCIGWASGIFLGRAFIVLMHPRTLSPHASQD